MTNPIYDIITVGGGLGGASLAKAMAAHGAKVLVLERETQFKDRVRGENIWSWGVAELKALGIDDLLRRTCACEITWFDISVGPVQVAHRNVKDTSLQQLPDLNFSHPAMQEVLLQGGHGGRSRSASWSAGS